jgi:hypothetical protein
MMERNIQPIYFLNIGFHKHPNLARNIDIVAIVQTLPDNLAQNNMPFGLDTFLKGTGAISP